MDKKCFKCHQVKSLDQFYKHSAMADGHLNKCIECTKKDVRRRFYDPASRPKIKEYERNRFQTAHRKAKTIEYQRTHRKKHPTRYKARNKVNNSKRVNNLLQPPCDICGNPKSEGHHATYRRRLQVVWLCFKHHREIHGQLID